MDVCSGFMPVNARLVAHRSCYKFAWYDASEKGITLFLSTYLPRYDVKAFAKARLAKLLPDCLAVKDVIRDEPEQRGIIPGQPGTGNQAQVQRQYALLQGVDSQDVTQF